MAPSSQKGPPQGSEVPSEIIAQAEAIATSTESRVEGSGQTSQSLGGSERRDRDERQRLESLASNDENAVTDSAQPPPYDGTYNSVSLSQDGLDTKADVASDGRVNIRFDQKTNKLSSLLVPALRSQLELQKPDEPKGLPPGYIPPSLGGIPGQVPPPPPMNVVVHVVGSRGDVQPFVALGQVLKKTYKHRVRLATHPVFQNFVEENGLEFFSIGGDPAELMAFMVKNPGLMPGKDALRSGDIGKRRKGMYEIVRGCWRSCFEAGDGTGIAVSDNQPIEEFNETNKPFVADAIIANPPSFAHVHIAEKLGVPLHLMFTMPWSPTQAFPHPLANIQSSNADTGMTNFISYAIVEMMTWQGLGDIINRFRESVLGLEAIELVRAPVLVSRLKIPYTYCWSPALIPKPQDWGHHISVSGFYFLSLAREYCPAQDLAIFLDSGPPPVYIGFGSIVLDDPNSMTKLIFDAVQRTGQRALVSKGWGGVGADELGIPEGVFMLGNTPHDWLFQRVSCVVHHGGAGTTAAGIALGKPTVVVPFFGDQPFWGAMVARAGAGPEPIPHKQLTAENLADAISMALKPVTLQKAQELGSKIASEKGSDVGAKTFHDRLNVDALRCSLSPSRVAVWQVKKTDVRLSGFAAAALGREGLLDFSQLRLFRYREYDAEDGPWEPISGAASALMGTISGLMMGVADVPVDLFKAFPRKSGEGKTKTSSKSLHDEDSIPKTESLDSAESAQGTSSESVGVTSGSIPEPNANKTSPSPSHTEAKSAESSAVSKSRSESLRGVSLSDAIGAGKGVGRVVDAGFKSPMDFTLSLAKGFHNAPRLYGDTSVRPHEHITGFQSGLKAAGKEFGYGFYDGISGLLTQPLEGAKKEGLSGFAKGFGKGIGGLVLKPAAGIWGIPGYTFKGLYKEMVKRLGSSVQNYIIASRVAQGYEDLEKATPEERVDIVSRWQNLHVGGLAKNKKERNSPTGLSDRAYGSLRDADDKDFENAIKDSVAATSTGNADEDRWIMRAIKASVAELRRASQEGRGDEALQRAINASIAEADAARSEKRNMGKNNQSHLESGAASLDDQHGLRQSEHPGPQTSSADEDDENLKLAIESSKQDVSSQHSTTDDDLAKAIAESLTESNRYDEGTRKAEEEERIVLDYVKRQSLLEEQHRNTQRK